MVKGISRAGPGIAFDELFSNPGSVQQGSGGFRLLAPLTYLPRPSHQAKAEGAEGTLGSPGKLPQQRGRKLGRLALSCVKLTSSQENGTGWS